MMNADYGLHSAHYEDNNKDNSMTRFCNLCRSSLLLCSPPQAVSHQLYSSELVRMGEVPQSTVWYFRFLSETWMKLASKQPWLSPDQVPHCLKASFISKLSQC